MSDTQLVQLLHALRQTDRPTDRVEFVQGPVPMDQLLECLHQKISIVAVGTRNLPLRDYVVGVSLTMYQVAGAAAARIQCAIPSAHICAVVFACAVASGCASAVQYPAKSGAALTIGYRGVNEADRRFPDYSGVDASVLETP